MGTLETEGGTMSFTRRDLLKLGAGAAAMCAAGVRPAGLRAAQANGKIPIALQLYSVRDVAPKDVPGTIEAVAKMGYQGVEFAGYYGQKADDLRKMLDQNGLKCCGTHTGLPTLAGDALKATVEFNKILGNEFLIVPSLPHTNMASVAALIDTAKLLTDLAERMKDSGMKVGYHAHGQDFKPLADRIPWEVLFSNAGPAVLMQLDVGNCMQGGGDPIAELKKFPHRSSTIHLKEHGGPKGAVVGEGDVPWKEIFALCETTGDTQWYIVEQESYRNSSMESVERCLKNLRNMGK
jgi:sugar phosphate isomerase/epimerase